LAEERVFIPGQGGGLADEAVSDAIPNAAGGEPGHGTARPDGVVHRCISNPEEVLSNNMRAEGISVSQPTASCAGSLNSFALVGVNNFGAPAQVCQLLLKPEVGWLLVLRLFGLLGLVRMLSPTCSL
jgi:hypothetical protein